jgi:hypothetical protein
MADPMIGPSLQPHEPAQRSTSAKLTLPQTSALSSQQADLLREGR